MRLQIHLLVSYILVSDNITLMIFYFPLSLLAYVWYGGNPLVMQSDQVTLYLTTWITILG